MTKTAQPESKVTGEHGFVPVEIGHWRGRIRADLLSSGLGNALRDPESLFARLGTVPVNQDERGRLAFVPLPELGMAEDGKPKKAVFKRFPPRWLRRSGQSRALITWSNSCAMIERGVSVPSPLAILQQHHQPWRSPSYLLVEIVEQTHKAREFRFAHESGRPLPLAVSYETFVQGLGRFVRQVHDRGVWHRDLGGGNILVSQQSCGSQDQPRLAFTLVDISRARIRPTLGLLARLRDLVRLTESVSSHWSLLVAYAGGEKQAGRMWRSYRFVLAGYRFKRKLKRGLRRWRKKRTRPALPQPNATGGG